jgi:hypothetical protein
MFSKPLIFVIPSILVIASVYSPIVTFYVFPDPPDSKMGTDKCTSEEQEESTEVGLEDNGNNDN